MVVGIGIDLLEVETGVGELGSVTDWVVESETVNLVTSGDANLSEMEVNGFVFVNGVLVQLKNSVGGNVHC